MSQVWCILVLCAFSFARGDYFFECGRPPCRCSYISIDDARLLADCRNSARIAFPRFSIQELQHIDEFLMGGTPFCREYRPTRHSKVSCSDADRNSPPPPEISTTPTGTTSFTVTESLPRTFADDLLMTTGTPTTVALQDPGSETSTEDLTMPTGTPPFISTEHGTRTTSIDLPLTTEPPTTTRTEKDSLPPTDPMPTGQTSDTDETTEQALIGSLTAILLAGSSALAVFLAKKFNCLRRSGTRRLLDILSRAQHGRSSTDEPPEVTLRYQIPIPPPRRSQSRSPPSDSGEDAEELVWDYSTTSGLRSVSISMDADKMDSKALIRALVGEAEDVRGAETLEMQDQETSADRPGPSCSLRESTLRQARGRPMS